MPPAPPPLMFDPETLIVVGIVGGGLAAATYVLYRWADAQGSVLAESDRLPEFPGPPVFRFENGLPKLPSAQ